MYGYWPAGGIDSHGEGATDHPETETPAVYSLPPPADRASIRRLNTLLASYTVLPWRFGSEFSHETRNLSVELDILLSILCSSRLRRRWKRNFSGSFRFSWLEELSQTS